jgi:hypothetical protein
VHIIGYCLIHKKGMVPMKRGGVSHMYLTKKGAESKLERANPNWSNQYFVAPVGIEDHVMVAEALDYLDNK